MKSCWLLGSPCGASPAGVFVGVLVAELAQQGERHDVQRGRTEVQHEAGREWPALRDGEAVLQGDVVHQHAGDGPAERNRRRGRR